jgi:hypothetical protein
MVDLKQISESLQKGRAKDVEAQVQQALRENVRAKDILSRSHVRHERRGRALQEERGVRP